MSVFAGHDISLNKYHYVFYSFSKSDPNTLKAQYYDSGQNLLGMQNISFSQRDIPAMLTFLENSQSNPYAIGKSPSGFRNMDIAFSGIYKKTLKYSQQQSLMTYVNKTFKNVYSNAVTVYEVKVNGSMYMIDDVEQPNLLAIETGIYVFDQSDSSNSGHLLKFRNLSYSNTPYTTNVTHEGTPGTQNSYSIIDVTETTPDLEYYCEIHTVSMYGEFKTLTDLTSYRVKVIDNVLGDPVFALSPPGTSEYYNQIDVSFGAGSKFLFDVSDPTMTDISLVFGTTVDDSSTINDSFVTYQDGLVILDICSGYVGESLKYFEDTSAGMGYIELSAGGSSIQSNIHYTFEDGVTNSGSDTVTTTEPSNGASISTTESKFGTQSLATGTTRNVLLSTSLSIQKEFSFSLWVYANTPQNTYFVATSASNGANWTLRSIDDRIWFDVLNGANELDVDLQTTYTNVWIHISCCLGYYYGTYQKRIYFNGVKRQAVNQTAPSSDYGNTKFDIGKNGEGNLNGYVDEFRIFDYALSDAQALEVYQYVPPILPIKHGVTVSGTPPVFYIDGSANPNLIFTPDTTYVFDLSHNSNAGNTFVLGTVPDSSVHLINYQTIVGTPGQPGAYTTFTASGETLYYYSYQNPNMGFKPPPYIVKVVYNVLGDTVFSIQKPDETDYYTQPDISFGAGFIGFFDVSDPTMADISLVFGTTVDDSSTINDSFVTYQGGLVILDICSGYVGESLKYFEDTSANMGYNKYLTPNTLNTLNTIFNGITEPSFYWDFRTTTPETDGTDTYVTDIMNVGSTNLKAVAKGDLSFNSLTGPTFDESNYIQIDPFTFGGKCSVEVYYKSTELKLWSRVIDFGQGVAQENFIIAAEGPETDKTGLQVRNGSTVKQVSGDTITTNTWYHVIVTSDSNGSGTVTRYLNDAYEVEMTNVTFPNINRSSNFVGNDNWGAENQSMYGQIGFVRIWQDHVLTTSEISDLYDKRDYHYESGNSSLLYTVTVSGSPPVFYIDGSANPNLTFTPDTTYIFDLSHNSNTGNTFVLSTDGTTSALINYQTVVGTPGQPGAYTSFTATSETVYYISYENTGMGNAPLSFAEVANTGNGLKHHFDANDATSVVLESGTDNVLSWVDQNNTDLSINYVTANKPTYVTAAYKYISLVDSGLKLSDSSVSSSHNLTVFQAFRIENSENDSTHSTVCMFGNDFDDNGAFQFLRLATSRELMMYYQGSTTTVWGSVNWATGYILDKNETYIIAYIFEETDSTKFNISLRITNSSNTTIWGPYEIDRGTNPLLKDNMYLCNWSKTGSYSRPLDANIYEYLMFEKTLTSDEIQVIETSLVNKYYSTEASLKYHFDASVTSSVVLDGNGKVSSWVDQNIGISAVAMNASLPPLYTNSMIQMQVSTAYGLYYTPQYESSMPEGIEITLFLAFHIDSLGTGYQTIYGFGDYNSHYDKNTDSHFLTYTDSKLHVYHKSPSAEGKLSDTFTFSDNTDYVMSVKYYKNASDGNNIYIQVRINGTAISIGGSTDLNTGTTELDSGQFDLFHSRAYVRTLSGKLGEFLYYEKALSTSEIQTIEASLTSKWFS